MSNLNSNNQKIQGPGILMVLSGPSGSGKSTLASKILCSDKNFFKSISYTTRLPRAGETNGVEYHFVSQAEFIELIRKDELLEYTKIHENLYGTPISQVQKTLESGKDILFDLDVNGAKFIREKMPDQSLDIFIIPPSVEELEKRLIARGKDSEESIKIRVKMASKEIEKAAEYDYIVLNDNIDRAFEEVMSILEKERSGRINISIKKEEDS